MLSSKEIKDIASEARPIIERQLDDADLIAGFRNVVASAGGDWSQLKALIKAQIQDERDEAGDGKRVRKIVEKAEFASAYADMLGLANMNENNFSAEELPSATVADRVDMGIPMSANSERLDRGAVNGDVSDPTDVTEAGSDGLTSVAQTNSHSSEPTSSPATTDKAEAASLLPSASATLPECSVGGGDEVDSLGKPNLEEGVQQTPSLPDNDSTPPDLSEVA